MRGHFGEQRRRDGARLRRLGHEDSVCPWKEQSRDLINGFVTERTVNKPDALIAKILLPERSEFARGSRVVSSIEKYGRGRRQLLQAAGPMRLLDTILDGFVFYRETAGCEQVRSRCSGQGIANLKPSRQR